MYSVKPPFFFRFFDPQYLLCRMPEGKNEVYLTFDDGPVPEVTPEVLAILDKKNVKATFFCVGENVKKHKTVFDEVVSAGHSTGNHTYSHLNGWKTPPAFYAENVYRCRDLFETKLFRPPYGRFTPSQYFLLRKDYKFIMWSVLSGDFSLSTPAEKCYDQVISNVTDGGVIVFHDSIKAKERMISVLPQVIDTLRDKGYSFGLIS